MALIPSNSINEPNWQVVNFSNEVLLIKDPGLPGEDVVIKYDAMTSTDLVRAFQELNAIEELTTRQKQMVYFWFGYFQASIRKR